MPDGGSKCTQAASFVAPMNSPRRLIRDSHIMKDSTNGRQHMSSKNVVLGLKTHCSKRSTYPEYDVESENEILDTAADFVSLEMLP